MSHGQNTGVVFHPLQTNERCIRRRCITTRAPAGSLLLPSPPGFCSVDIKLDVDETAEEQISPGDETRMTTQLPHIHFVYYLNEPQTSVSTNTCGQQRKQ